MNPFSSVTVHFLICNSRLALTHVRVGEHGKWLQCDYFWHNGYLVSNSKHIFVCLHFLYQIDVNFWRQKTLRLGFMLRYNDCVCFCQSIGSAVVQRTSPDNAVMSLWSSNGNHSWNCYSLLFHRLLAADLLFSIPPRTPSYQIKYINVDNSKGRIFNMLCTWGLYRKFVLAWL